jgi:hypothetical protein
LKHFALNELVDKTTFETLGNKAWSLFNEEVLFALDDLREYFNASITINTWARGGASEWRGYRSPACPIGAKHSQHRLGNAFDCTIKGYTAAEARAEIIAHQENELLKRIMRLEDKVSWVHFDCGAVPEGKQRIYLFIA